MYSVAGTLLIMFFMKCIRLEVCKCYALEKTSCEEFDKRFYKSPKCGFRHEVQYDYAKFYNVKDCSNFTYCLCQKPIYVRYAEFPPYIYEVNNGSANNVEGILPAILRDALYVCCFGCVNIVYLPKVKCEMELIIAREDYTMFGPILSGNDGDTYGGRPYVRLMSSPYVYFVTWDKPRTKNLHKLLTALKGAWPLLCVILLLAVEAGVLIWLTDTWFNENVFPHCFTRGPIEGFWWAFISMTTVGYGDRTPRSLLARLIAVLWITLGIAISGVFNATLTSALTQAMIDDNIDLTGLKVGTLNHTRYEYSVVLRERGKPRTYGDITELKQAFQRQEIEVPPEASEWATYIQGYFETNKRNEDLIVALATDTIESKEHQRIPNFRHMSSEVKTPIKLP